MEIGMIRLIVFSAGVMASIIALTQISLANPSSNLRVTFVGCAGTTAGEKLTVIRIPNGHVEATMPISATEVPKIWEARTSVPSGLYQVVFGQMPCVASRPIALLADVNRSVVFVGADVLHLEEGAIAIAGSLPSDGLLVSAECKSPSGSVQHYDADVDGRAYYFDAITTRGTCDLVVSINETDINRKAVLGHVVISSSGSTKFVLRDIVWSDIVGPK